MGKKNEVEEVEEKLSPELQKKGEEVSQKLKALLEDNGFALSIEMVYGKNAISAKPTLVPAPKND